ncbi:hypothetical protein [Streptomyces sp. NPDC046332]|uniref:hypothetical protein n=1 Tax=unclassified Streptomyces TaxID=2593676 RepID=UPI0033E63B42
MAYDIPTTPCEDPAETIMAAVAHGMSGNPALGLSLLGPFIEEGARTTVSMCAALASMVAVAAEKQHPAAGTFGFIAIHHGYPTNVAALPPGPRFAAQFTAAWLNGQQQTAYALFHALTFQERDEDAANLAEGVLALYELAVESALSLRGGDS